MNNKTLIERDFEIVKVERIDGEMTTEEGRTFNWHNYKVHFKALDNPLIMTAKVDKVFNDYIEGDPND